MGDQGMVVVASVTAAEHMPRVVVKETDNIGMAVAPNVVQVVVSAMLVATVVAAMGAECPAFAIVAEAFVVVVVVGGGLIVDVVVEIVVAAGLIVDIVVVIVVGSD